MTVRERSFEALWEERRTIDVALVSWPASTALAVGALVPKTIHEDEEDDLLSRFKPLTRVGNAEYAARLETRAWGGGAGGLAR